MKALHLLTKSIASSANMVCEIIEQPLLEYYSWMSRCAIARLMDRLRISLISMKRARERGSPCRRPREVVKKGVECPFTSREKGFSDVGYFEKDDECKMMNMSVMNTIER